MAQFRADPHLSANWRAKIKTSLLLNRLQDFSTGKIEMTRGQVLAAQILLRKVLPDVSSVDIGSADGKPLTVSIIKFSDLADDDKPTER